MVIAVAINWLAWVIFLTFTPPAAASDFQQILRGRAERYSGGGLMLISDQPTMMAARWFGGFRAMPLSERFLVLMAGAPTLMTEQYVVPARYAGSPPTRGESYVVAVIAFVLSTAFWTIVAGGIGWLGRRNRGRRPPDKRLHRAAPVRNPM